MKLFLICIAAVAWHPLAEGQIAEIFKFGMQVIQKINENYEKKEDEIKSATDAMKETTMIIESNTFQLKLSTRQIVAEINRLMSYHEIMYNLKVNGGYIDSLYKKFLIYSSNRNVEPNTLEDFARTCVSHERDALPGILNLIVQLSESIDNNKATLFEFLLRDKDSNICGTKSNQQEIYSLYNIIGVYILKGYTMILHSYYILREGKHGKYVLEISTATAEYKESMIKIRASAISALKKASKAVRPCDPKKHKEYETYTQLKWLFTLTVVDNRHLSDGGCQLCEDHGIATFVNPKINHGYHECQGEFRGCYYEHFDEWCPATEPYRKYNGFTAYSSIILQDYPARGITKDCDNQPMLAFAHRHFENRALGGQCSLCICDCDARFSKSTVRAFSLKPVEARTTENRVITGVRLVERSRIFHIQVQDGVLQPNGIIDESTLEWLPIPPLYWKPDQPAVDYYTVDYKNNHLNLDTFSLPSGRVLTGVKFSTGARKNILEIKYKDSIIDIPAGKVIDDGEFWWSSGGSPSRNKIVIDEPDIPILGKDINVEHAGEDSYIAFQQTDWIKDASQITVPFLDTQPVVVDPPVPLSGFGIYYKGQKGYGGFIGLKVLTYDAIDLVPYTPNEENID